MALCQSFEGSLSTFISVSSSLFELVHFGQKPLRPPRRPAPRRAGREGSHSMTAGHRRTGRDAHRFASQPVQDRVPRTASGPRPSLSAKWGTWWPAFLPQRNRPRQTLADLASGLRLRADIAEVREQHLPQTGKLARGELGPEADNSGLQKPHGRSSAYVPPGQQFQDGLVRHLNSYTAV